jgi:ankyrin repeat protein
MAYEKKILCVAISIKSFFIFLCVSLIISHYYIDKAVDHNLMVMIDAYGVDAFDEDGWTPLLKASNDGNAAAAAAFIGAGADLDARAVNFQPLEYQPSSWTPLHYAIFNLGKASLNMTTNVDPYYEIARMLLAAGANPRIPNNHGETPIFSAIQILDSDQRAEMVARMVKRGANINEQNENGETFAHKLMYNRERSWVEILKTRFGSIINLDLINKDGFTPRQLADELWFTDVVQMYDKTPYKIIGTYDTNEIDPMTGMTGLMLATIKGDRPFINLLITRGADVNARIADDEQDNALQVTLLHQNPEMLKILLDSNANPNQANLVGDRPLNYVLKIDEFGKKYVASLLNPVPVANKAINIYLADLSKQIQQDYNVNKLMNPERMRDYLRNLAAAYLIEKGADVNAQNNFGDTLLHQAVRANAVGLIDFLVKFYGTKINPRILNSRKRTAYQLAIGMNRLEIVRLLGLLETGMASIGTIKAQASK